MMIALPALQMSVRCEVSEPLMGTGRHSCQAELGFDCKRTRNHSPWVIHLSSVSLKTSARLTRTLITGFWLLIWDLGG